MRRFLGRDRFAVFICVVLSFFAASAAAGAQSAVSASAVDFYPSGAKFTFQTEADGSFELSLPGAFDKNSVRCLNLDKLTFLDIETDYITEAARPEELAVFIQKADDAQRAVNILQARKTTLNQASEMLQAPFAKKHEGENGVLRFDGKALIEYVADAQKLRLDIETELVEIGMSESKAQDELKAAQEELDAARRKLEEKRPYNSETIIRVRGVTSEKSTVLLEAHTAAAGWNVEYDMNLDSATGGISAVMTAKAWQRTGIDIDGELSFHTRQPSFGIAPPDIAPLSVGLAEPVTRRAEDSLNKSMAFGEAAPMAAFETDGAVRAFAAPDAVLTLANVTVKGSGHIGGDGRAAGITLGEFVLKSEPILVAIPEQNDEAWIVASMDEIPSSFLPGIAKLAVDSAATGNTIISDAAGLTQIPFGMAAKVKSKKERFVGKTGSSWTGKGVLHDGYTLEITSDLQAGSEITVRDRIPIPTTDKVAISVVRIDPEPTERDSDNRLMWKINLKPRETKKITVEYEIKYPSGDTLTFGRVSPVQPAGY